LISVPAEAKRERQRKVVKDRAVKTEKQEIVQGDFGHDSKDTDVRPRRVIELR
jgi:hypothetical protein